MLGSWFEVRAREGGEGFVALRDGRPEWLFGAVMAAHDGEGPDDWRYEVCRHIVGLMDEFDPAEWDDSVFEWAESLADVYNGELASWLAGQVGRSAWVDEWVSVFGAGDGLWVAVRGGQSMCIEQMARTLIDAVTDAYAGYVAECEAENLDAHDLDMWLVRGCPEGPIG